MGSPAAQLMIVEGPDDHHGLLHLLIRSGVLPECKKPLDSPVQFIELKGKSKILADIPTRPKESGLKAVGYILDADGYPREDGQRSGDPPGLGPTWQAVSHRLNKLGIVPPASISKEGFVGQVGDKGPKIGIWIMPDNELDGALEEFLVSLTKPGDPLLVHARAATEAARKNYGATFAEAARPKAELSCWLSWQPEPAMTYGQAMKAGKFSPNKTPADGFIRWVQQLFTI